MPKGKTNCRKCGVEYPSGFKKHKCKKTRFDLYDKLIFIFILSQIFIKSGDLLRITEIKEQILTFSPILSLNYVLYLSINMVSLFGLIVIVMNLHKTAKLNKIN